MKNGLVSVIMPMYNCAAYLEESVRSVVNQTYQNWELLIVDDMSTDGSWEIAKKLAEQDPRIRLLQNKKNSGAAVSRNYALREAKGKWIAFLDSDDVWLPEKLSEQICFMEKNDYHFSYTQYIEMTEVGVKTGILWTGPKCVTKAKLFAYNFIGCLTVMYDREVAGLIQIPDLKKRNDYAMWLKVIKTAHCYLLDKPLSQYRVRTTGSVTDRKKGVLPMIRHHYNVFRYSEEMCVPAAAFWTGCNLVFGVLKKIIYKKHVSF